MRFGVLAAGVAAFFAGDLRRAVCMRRRIAWLATATRPCRMQRATASRVDGKTFGASIHGSLQCNNCHADIKEYPHPDQIAKVDCKTCHADEASRPRRQRALGFEGPSLHQLPRQRARRSFPRPTARSAVYPLNVPKTCGKCHSNGGMANKHGLSSVYPHVHGLDPRIRAEQGRPAGCGQLPELPRIASHSEPQESSTARRTKRTSPRPAAPATPRSTTTTCAARTATLSRRAI